MSGIKNALLSCLQKIKDYSILVVGDIILDHYIWGEVSRISPEAPVPVVDVIKESYLLGGASNVANNIRSLGAKVWLSGVVGEDVSGEILQGLLRDRGINSLIIKSKSRPTILKSRVIARQQQLLRFDREKRHRLSELELDGILRLLKGIDGDINGVIVSDYAKGVINEDLMNFLLNFCKKRGLPIFVDPKPINLLYYRGASAITPNQHEAEQLAGFKAEGLDGLLRICKEIIKKVEVEKVLVTRGHEGMALYSNGILKSIPTMAKEVYDVTGAGDTAIATFALGIVSGLEDFASVVFSNICAGLVVSKLGTAVITEDEVLKAINSWDETSLKIEEISEDA